MPTDTERKPYLKFERAIASQKHPTLEPPRWTSRALPYRAPLPRIFASAALCCALSLTVGCDAPVEADRVYLPVQLDASELVSVTNDLGYRVELSSVRIAFRDMVFNVQGEEHVASVFDSLWDVLIPRAHAHPGHFEGGVVTGELLGQFVADWLTDNPPTLGEATLLSGRYHSFSFTFSQAPSDESTSDPQHEGHTAVLKGTATREGQETPFTIIIDSPLGRVLADAPTDLAISKDSTGALLFQVLTRSTLDDATLFDELDFHAYRTDDTDKVTIQAGDTATEDAYNTIVRAFQSFDFYRVLHAN